ncbi:hypothetical protein QN277_003165 [Acacia crassicarpa]|uniref:DUF4283 domain-containing protein n=1 Tax=Acacia crassicarpa TaxID=499986 RepID=A0AAE1MAK4_9FABA|nr:hypothetical protein QN277_003165 [Acacia crassicarpa]
MNEQENMIVPSSKEEDDLLTRSSKKIKNVVVGNEKEILQGHWPKLGETTSAFNVGGSSFADKLKGVDRSSDELEDDKGDDLSDDSLSDYSPEEKSKECNDWKCKISESLSRNFPTFHFSDKMKQRLYKAWGTAVIVKLLGRNIGFRALESRLQAMWAKRGVFNLINIGHGYYIVKFTNKEDYNMALTGGPWLLYDHYLIVKPWEAGFRPDKAEIEKAAVWVRIPKIPLEYYDEVALTVIGNRIGKTLKVDMNTSGHLRGHFARICVLVELDKQMMQGFYLDNQEFFIEYEGLHLLCTCCGIYGHRKETCPQRNRDNGCTSEPAVGKTTANADQHVDQKQDEQWRIVQKP